VTTPTKPNQLMIVCEICGHSDAAVCGDPTLAPPYCDIRLSVAEAWRVKRQQLHSKPYTASRTM
jgi:hypothetical protein